LFLVVFLEFLASLSAKEPAAIWDYDYCALRIPAGSMSLAQLPLDNHSVFQGQLPQLTAETVSSN